MAGPTVVLPSSESYKTYLASRAVSITTVPASKVLRIAPHKWKSNSEFRSADASATRDDAYFGDDHTMVPELYAQMQSVAADYGGGCIYWML